MTRIADEHPAGLVLRVRVESVLPTTNGGDGRQLYDLELQPLEGPGIYRAFGPIRLPVDEAWAAAVSPGQQVVLMAQF